MHRKDFQVVAEVLAGLGRQDRSNLAPIFAASFARTYPNFRADKFLRAAAFPGNVAEVIAMIESMKESR